MLKSDAKRLIPCKFREWCRHRGITAPTMTDGFVFYNELDKARSPLLRFRNRGDKWQTVQGWLNGSGLLLNH